MGVSYGKFPIAESSPHNAEPFSLLLLSESNLLPNCLDPVKCRGNALRNLLHGAAQSESVLSPKPQLVKWARTQPDDTSPAGTERTRR